MKQLAGTKNGSLVQKKMFGTKLTQMLVQKDVWYKNVFGTIFAFPNFGAVQMFRTEISEQVVRPYQVFKNNFLSDRTRFPKIYI